MKLKYRRSDLRDARKRLGEIRYESWGTLQELRCLRAVADTVERAALLARLDDLQAAETAAVIRIRSIRKGGVA